MTDQILLDPADIEAEVRRLAAERPEFVYETPELDGGSFSKACNYVHGDDTPGCIFGHALLALGVSPTKLAVFDLRPESGIQIIAYEILKEHPPLRFLDWATQVQQIQDSGGTWAEAVKGADVRVF